MTEKIKKLEDYTAKQVVEAVTQIMSCGSMPRLTIVRNDDEEDCFDILLSSMTEKVAINCKYSAQGWDVDNDLVVVYNTNDFNDAKTFAKQFLLPRTDIATVMLVDVESGKGLSID